MNKYVIYYRVSSDEQQKDGISLDVQLTKCRELVEKEGGVVIGEFNDTTSAYKTGRNSGRNRPGLRAAADLARKEDAILLLAKLSRLGRDLEFAWNLKNSGLKMQFLDFPQITDIVFSIMMTIYQEESKIKSEYARESWSHIKERIEIDGHYYSRRGDTKFTSISQINPSWEANRELGPIAAGNIRTQEKCTDEKWQMARKLAIKLQKDGVKIDNIVSTLNETDHRTRRGNLWTHNSVWRLLNAKLA